MEKKMNENELTCHVVKNRADKVLCFRIRNDVFVRELRMFKDTDIDRFDDEAVYIAVRDDAEIIGTVRVYRDDNGRWFGGRLAVKKEKRKASAAKMLVKKAEEVASYNGADILFAMVQEKNVNFFKKTGWEVKEGPLQHRSITHYIMSVNTTRR